MVGMMEFNCVGDDLAPGVTLDKLEAPVLIQGRLDVETFLGAEIPQATSDRLGMNEYAATNGTKRGLVEIKWALEEFPCRDPRIESRLSQ